jgi:hypothetical protein
VTAALGTTCCAQRSSPRAAEFGDVIILAY